MLVQFRVKNYRSFLDEAVLSMQAAKDREFDQLNTFYIHEGPLPKGENELLKSALIFGPNASGKSNMLKGLRYMQQAVLFSQVTLPQNIIESNESFAFLEHSSKINSMYEVEFLFHDVFYRYGFEIREFTIVNEYLYRRYERLTLIFKRDQQGIQLMGLPKTVSQLVKLNQHTLFLSIANNYQFSEDLSKAIQHTMKWFQDLLIVFEENVNTFMIYEQKNKSYYDEALRIMQMADLGIHDFKVYKERVMEKDGTLNTKTFNASLIYPSQINANSEGVDRLDLKTIFNIYDKHGVIKGKKETYLLKQDGFNSEGTKKLLFYLGWILLSLDEGRVLLLDELDSKLHFLLADYILKQFNSLTRNRKHGQLISTAHNLMLMDESMRRDQIYFASKNERGESHLSSLSDYQNVRKTDLFSKKYLKGFYEALPEFMDDML